MHTERTNTHNITNNGKLKCNFKWQKGELCEGMG